MIISVNAPLSVLRGATVQVSVSGACQVAFLTRRAPCPGAFENTPTCLLGSSQVRPQEVHWVAFLLILQLAVQKVVSFRTKKGLDLAGC